MRIHPEHVDLALALGEVGGLRLEVELEAEGAGAGAGEAGEGDDEVFLVGVVGVLGHVECEGDVGRASGFGAISADGGRETLAVCGAVRHVAEVWDREINGGVWERGVDLVGGGRLKGGAAIGVGAFLSCGES